MPELYVQTLYAVLITLAISVGVVTWATDNLRDGSYLKRKPFTCVYCMTVWVALCVCAAVFQYPTNIVMWPLTHILAYILYQKAI